MRFLRPAISVFPSMVPRMTLICGVLAVEGGQEGVSSGRLRTMGVMMVVGAAPVMPVQGLKTLI